MAPIDPAEWVESSESGDLCQQPRMAVADEFRRMRFETLGGLNSCQHHEEGRQHLRPKDIRALSQ